MVPRTGIFLQIASLSLFGGNYYFTYSLTADNMIVSSEKLQISKKMTPTNSKPNRFFQILNDKNATSEKNFIEFYKDDIVELILTQKASIKSAAKTDASYIAEHSTVRSLPTLVSVDFKEDFGIIGIYE